MFSYQISLKVNRVKLSNKYWWSLRFLVHLLFPVQVEGEHMVNKTVIYIDFVHSGLWKNMAASTQMSHHWGNKRESF